jgi:hypothetical protein
MLQTGDFLLARLTPIIPNPVNSSRQILADSRRVSLELTCQPSRVPFLQDHHQSGVGYRVCNGQTDLYQDSLYPVSPLVEVHIFSVRVIYYLYTPPATKVGRELSVVLCT